MKVFHEKSLIEINKEKEENGKLKKEVEELKIRIRTNSSCIE